MWTRRSLLVALALPAATAAFAQASLKPDTTPRMPPQAGQGLPIEDKDFLQRASNLSRAEIDAGKVAAEKANDPALKTLASDLANEHTTLLAELRERAARFDAKAAVDDAKPGGWETDIKLFSGLTGEAFDRGYLGWQMRAHLALVNLYQTQASHSPESDLAKFAIIRLNEIQRRFDALKELGGRYGLKADTVGQPPQY